MYYELTTCSMSMPSLKNLPEAMTEPRIISEPSEMIGSFWEIAAFCVVWDGLLYLTMDNKTHCWLCRLESTWESRFMGENCYFKWDMCHVVSQIESWYIHYWRKSIVWIVCTLSLGILPSDILLRFNLYLLWPMCLLVFSHQLLS